MPRSPVHSNFSVFPLAPCSTEDRALVTPSSGQDSGEGSADASDALLQSEREGERTDLPLAGLEKAKGSLSLLSCLCLCLCLCLCFFFFFLCSW